MALLCMGTHDKVRITQALQKIYVISLRKILLTHAIAERKSKYEYGTKKRELKKGCATVKMALLTLNNGISEESDIIFFHNVCVSMTMKITLLAVRFL